MRHLFPVAKIPDLQNKRRLSNHSFNQSFCHSCHSPKVSYLKQYADRLIHPPGGIQQRVDSDLFSTNRLTRLGRLRFNRHPTGEL
jgi:hypothetical protein